MGIRATGVELLGRRNVPTGHGRLASRRHHRIQNGRERVRATAASRCPPDVDPVRGAAGEEIVERHRAGRGERRRQTIRRRRPDARDVTREECRRAQRRGEEVRSRRRRDAEPVLCRAWAVAIGVDQRAVKGGSNRV